MSIELVLLSIDAYLVSLLFLPLLNLYHKRLLYGFVPDISFINIFEIYIRVIFIAYIILLINVIIVALLFSVHLERFSVVDLLISNLTREKNKNI